MTDRQHRWAVFCLIWGLALLILALAVVLIVPPKAHGQGPCGPVGCATGNCGPGVGVGIRGGYGYGLQAGVMGPYGGLIGAQVGPGPRVQAGVIPPRGTSAGVLPIPSTVKIESDGGTFVRHGTGTLIDVLPDQPGNPWLVLTAAHILTDSPTAIVAGQRVALRVVALDAIRDVALLARAEYRPIPAHAMQVLRQSPPTAGWQGFAEGRRLVGGGGTVLRDGDKIAVPGQAAEGTSGGPIYGQAGLASVITETNDQGTGRWVTAGPSTEWLYEWVQTAYQTAQQDVAPPPLPVPGPVSIPVPGPIAEDEGDRLPHRPVVAVTRSEFRAAMDEIKARDQEIVDRLMAHSSAIAEITARLDSGDGIGPPGPQGPPGKDGRDGIDADPATLDALAGRVAVLEAKCDTAPPPPGPVAATYADLVVRTDTDYWRWMEAEVKRAQGAFSIRVVEAPEVHQFGVLPKLVFYRDGTPIGNVTGVNEVRLTLSRLRDGELPF